MSEGPALQQSNQTSSPWPHFPKAILSVSRKEHYQEPLGLTIFSRKHDSLQADAVDCSSADFLNSQYWQQHSPQDPDQIGPLPDSLKGHVFVIGTAASFDSQKVCGTEHIYLPTQDGWQHIYSGDGMIYRLDFHSSTLHADKTDNPDSNQPYTTIPKQGWAYLATRLIKTPDYFADLALEEKHCYQSWQNYAQSTFVDAALTRLSMSLGGRNFLNTAWLPLKPKHSNSERLLVTWDAGRPYEVDPCSLGLVAPVGLNKDWKPTFDMNQFLRRWQKLPGLSQLFPILSQVFPLILASAHPVYDDYEDAVYGVNASKSLQSMMQIPKLVPYFKQGFLKFLSRHADPDQETLQPSWLDQILATLVSIILMVIHGILTFLSLLGIGGRDHLFLYRWHGDQTEIDDSEKWEIVDEQGWTIPIYQSLHQMALTKDYIIISDSSFKFVMADVLPSLLNPQDFAKNLRGVVNKIISFENRLSKISEALPIPKIPQKQSIREFGVQPPVSKSSGPPSTKPEPKPTKQILREQLQFLFSFLNYAQTPYTDVYVVRRSDLKSTSNSSGPDSQPPHSPRNIKAKHFCLEPETAHFLASYDNPDHKVILHVGHIPGLDPAEFVNGIDDVICDYSAQTHTAQPCPEDINEILQNRAGVLANSLAPNQLGVWTLDLNTGAQEKVFLEDEDKFQLLAFFTFNEKTTRQVTDVYWNCGGIWPHHHTINQFELYKDQIDPKVIEQQLNLAKAGRPANLLRVNQSATLDPGNSASGAKPTIEDCYNFPPGFYASSPQFVPKAGEDNAATDGYIVCVVVATDHLETDGDQDCKLSELWIFDAAHLSQGPLYRLNHPELNIGPTLHTAWLSKLESPPLRPDYDVRADYETILDQIEPPDFKHNVRHLFEQDVFPNVIRDRSEALPKLIFKLRIFDTSLAVAALQKIHRAVEDYAAVCGYHEPEILSEDFDTRLKDVQYHTQDSTINLTQEQYHQSIDAGVMMHRQGKSNPQIQREELASELPPRLAVSTATLLQMIEEVDNAVLWLGPLILIRVTEPKSPSKTYVKRVSAELQSVINHTPALLDSSQAMVNFLYNREELPDAIADPSAVSI